MNLFWPGLLWASSGSFKVCPQDICKNHCPWCSKWVKLMKHLCTAHCITDWRRQMGKKESRGEAGQFCWVRGELGWRLREAAWISGFMEKRTEPLQGFWAPLQQKLSGFRKSLWRSDCEAGNVNWTSGEDSLALTACCPVLICGFWLHFPILGIVEVS